MNSIRMKNFLGQCKTSVVKNFHRSDLWQNRRSIFARESNDEKRWANVSMKVSKSIEFVRLMSNEDEEFSLSLSNDSTRSTRKNVEKIQRKQNVFNEPSSDEFESIENSSYSPLRYPRRSTELKRVFDFRLSSVVTVELEEYFLDELN